MPLYKRGRDEWNGLLYGRMHRSDVAGSSVSQAMQ